MQVIEKKQKISLVAISLCIYFILLPFDCLNIGGSGSLLKVYAVIPLACLVLSGGGLVLQVGKITKYLLLFLLIIFFSIYYSIDSSISISAVISTALNVMLILMVSSCYIYNEREKKWLMNSMVISGWVMVVCYLLFSDFLNNGRLLLSFGADSTQDPNYANGYMLTAFSFHVYKVLGENKFLHLPLVITLFVVVILTGSRGALIAYLVCIILTLFLSLKNNAHRVQIIIGAIIVSIVFYYGYIYLSGVLDSSLTERFSIDFLEKEGSTGRTEIWANLLGHYRDANPFRQLLGHGYGTSYLVNTTTSVSTAGLVAHNLYIDDLITIGLFGAIVRIGVQIESLKSFIRSKNTELFCSFCSMIIMCMSLSLVNYKPIWAITMMAIIVDSRDRSKMPSA